MEQYAEPPETTGSVPLEELYPLGVYPLGVYPLGRTAENPALVSYANDEGHVVAILPESGGISPEGGVLVLAVVVVGALLLFRGSRR